MKSAAEKLREKIAKLERELAEIETGIVDVYPGESFSAPERFKEIRLHMGPITHMEFAKSHILMWSGSERFLMNIKPDDKNSEFIVRVV